MDSNELFTLGLGLTAPWKIVSQSLDLNVLPHRLDLRIEAERGALYPCPTCGRACKAHDFKEFTWRHLNFFQHHCYVTAPVPRTDCPEHGVLVFHGKFKDGKQVEILSGDPDTKERPPQ